MTRKVNTGLCRTLSVWIEAHYLKWQPKNRETRVIPMCPELQTMLLDAFQNAPDGMVRVCPQIYIGNVPRDMKATIKRAGVKP